MAKRKIRVITAAHTLAAISLYFRSLSMIDDDQIVTSFKKVPEGIEVTIEQEKD